MHLKPILENFSQLKNVPVTIVPRSGTQNIVQKEKVAVSGVLSEGRSLLQSAPLLRNSPPDCFAIHTPQSALRVKVSLIAMSDRGPCPLDTHKPFFEGLDPKIHA